MLKKTYSYLFDMASIKFNSIRQRYTAWLIIVIAIILFIFSFFLIRYNNLHAKKELSQQLTNISNIAKISLSTALWQYNHAYVYDYMDSLFLYDDIVLVSIYTEDKLVKTQSRPGFKNKAIDYFKNSSNFLINETPIVFNNITVGKIIIIMSYDRINRLIFSNSSLAILLLCFVILAIVVTNYFLLTRYIFKPVNKLETSAQLIAAGDLDAEIDTTSIDEIGNLAKTFQQMMHNIKAVTASRNDLNHEVKERQKAQTALEETNERFLQLANNTSDLFWLFDVSDLNRLKVLYLNPSYEIIWNQRIEDVYKSPDLLLKRIHPEDKKTVIKSFFSFIKTKSYYHIEFRIIDPDDSVKYLRARGNLIFDKDGKYTRVAGIAQDITERFQAQKEKEKLKNQLQHAHKMEAIGTLAGGIAHDFNNILGIIIGNAELAIDDVPKENPARISLEEIIVASKRAKDVVWQLLSFSRKSEREKEPVVVASILKESLALLRSSIPKTIDIQLKLPDSDPQMMADATQIHQVIINLCTNAAHAMADSGGKLIVKLEEFEIDETSPPVYSTFISGKYIKIFVIDTGHGIDAEIKDRIFDPYFTTKSIGKGTGMGLAVVHGIVKNHGGDISVQSDAAQGTTFEIVFPALSKEIMIKSTAVNAIPGGSESILLVDDEDSLIDIGQRMLTRLGYTVETRTNPIDAISFFKQNSNKVDLIITDMTMPEMTGDKMIKEILEIKQDTPIILCTGYSEKITEQEAIQIGAKKYIEKPLNLQELAASVRETLDSVD